LTRSWPWRYPYQEDGPRLDSIVLRPIVPVTLIGVENLTSSVFALVDSGCEHVLISQGLARSVGLDYRGSQREITLGIGGQTVQVHFLPATLRLHPDQASDDEFFEWHTDVGVIREWKPTFQVLLGQVGFMDQFTVTMSRHAQETAIEAITEYDKRFTVQYGRGASR
jgi:hypothetical protein